MKKQNIFWTVIVVLAILGFIYWLMNRNKKSTSTLTTNSGGRFRYQIGGSFPSSTNNNTNTNTITNTRRGHHDGNFFPIFRTVNVIPVTYPQCPDWSSKTVQNISFYGASNLFFPNEGVIENCPSCITYNGISYYFNGSDANGCYYQSNYNYILPQFTTFNNFGFRGRGHR